MEQWNRITEGIVCYFIGACQSNLSDGKIMKSCKWTELLVAVTWLKTLCSLSQCTKTCGFFFTFPVMLRGSWKQPLLPGLGGKYKCDGLRAADFYSKLLIVLRMVTWTWYRLLIRLVHPQCREEASASLQCCVNRPILHFIKHKVGLR